MNITFLISISLLVVAALVLLIISRSTLILLMLLPASEMLGFLNPSILALKGAFDIHALLAAMITIALVFSAGHLRELPHARLFKPMLILSLLWLYGVSAPVFRGHSQVFLALEASKEFLMIFSYFGIYLFFRTRAHIDWGWNFLLMFGVYYSFVEVVAQIFGPTLMTHMSYFYRPDAFGLWKVYVQFWPLILLAFFYYYFSFILGISRPFIRIALGGAGLLLTFYRSYLLASIVSIPLILLLSKQGVSRTVMKSSILIAITGIIALSLVLALAPSGKSLEKVGDAFLFSGAMEILGEKTSGSLAGRETYARQLREIAEHRPLFGYGFINREAKLIPDLKMHAFAGRALGFIDKGDIDVVIKFGYLGAVILYGTFLLILILLLKDARKRTSDLFTVRLLTVATTILVFFFVQPVHSAFTYSFSLFPLGVALGLIDRERCLIENEGRNDT